MSSPVQCNILSDHNSTRLIESDMIPSFSWIWYDTRWLVICVPLQDGHLRMFHWSNVSLCCFWKFRLKPFSVNCSFQSNSLYTYSPWVAAKWTTHSRPALPLKIFLLLVLLDFRSCWKPVILWYHALFYLCAFLRHSCTHTTISWMLSPCHLDMCHVGKRYGCVTKTVLNESCLHLCFFYCNALSQSWKLAYVLKTFIFEVDKLKTLCWLQMNWKLLASSSS